MQMTFDHKYKEIEHEIEQGKVALTKSLENKIADLDN